MEASNYQATEHEGINLLDYLPVLWKYRLQIGLLFLASVLYGLISGLLIPRVYEATATVVRDTGEGGSVSLLSLLAEQVAASRGTVSSGRGDNFMLVLRSRTMAEYMVRQLKLQEYYGASSFQAAVGTLRAATKILRPRDGPMSITVEDKDPGKAAEIANAYAENLNRHMSLFGAGVASRQRQFIIERLKDTEKALTEAEEVLKSFQLKNRAVVVAAQTTEAIGASTGLRADLIATEIQLQNVRSFATDSNPEVNRLKRKIAELKRQIAQAQYGSGMDLPSISQSPGNSQKDIYLPAAKVPEVQLEFTRLTRDVKVQEGVYTLLTQQLEQAKITEAQDLPVVQILDPALPPGDPKPLNLLRRMSIYGIVGIFLGAFAVLTFDYATRHWSIIRLRLIRGSYP